MAPSRLILASEHEMILVDALGAGLIIAATHGHADQTGLYLELEGRLNKGTGRRNYKALLSLGQAAELIAELQTALTA